MDNYNKIKHKVENGVNEFLMKTFIKRNVEEMFNDFVSENDFEDRTRWRWRIFQILAILV